MKIELPTSAYRIHAWGFCDRYDKELELQKKQLPTQFDQEEEMEDTRDLTIKERRSIVLYNILNGFSWILSPVIGIIRIIATQILRKTVFDEEDGPGKYIKMQLLRGVMEIFCLGPIFAVVDPIISAQRYLFKKD